MPCGDYFELRDQALLAHATQVEPDGEVTFCGDFPDYFIGNVRKQPFRDIWMGEKAQRFRAKLAKEPLPICARCCGSYVYGKWEQPTGRPSPHPDNAGL